MFGLSPVDESTVQSESNAPAARHFDFKDDEVEGELHRPDGELVTSTARAKQGSPFEIRQNFVPKHHRNARGPLDLEARASHRRVIVEIMKSLTCP